MLSHCPGPPTARLCRQPTPHYTISPLSRYDAYGVGADHIVLVVVQLVSNSIHANDGWVDLTVDTSLLFIPLLFLRMVFHFYFKFVTQHGFLTESSYATVTSPFFPPPHVLPLFGLLRAGVCVFWGRRLRVTSSRVASKSSSSISIMKRTFVSNFPLRTPSRPLRQFSPRWPGDSTRRACQYEQRHHASDNQATRPKTALFFPGL